MTTTPLVCCCCIVIKTVGFADNVRKQRTVCSLDECFHGLFGSINGQVLVQRLATSFNGTSTRGRRSKDLDDILATKGWIDQGCLNQQCSSSISRIAFGKCQIRCKQPSTRDGKEIKLLVARKTNRIERIPQFRVRVSVTDTVATIKCCRSTCHAKVFCTVIPNTQVSPFLL